MWQQRHLKLFLPLTNSLLLYLWKSKEGKNLKQLFYHGFFWHTYLTHRLYCHCYVIMIIKLTLLSILFIRSRKILLRKNKNQTKKPTSKIHTTSDFLNLIYHNTTMTCCPCTYYHALSSIISFIYIYHQVKRKIVNSIDKIKHNCLLWKQKIKKKNDTSFEKKLHKK